MTSRIKPYPTDELEQDAALLSAQDSLLVDLDEPEPEDPTVTETPDGGALVDLEPSGQPASPLSESTVHSANLAEHIDEETLQTMAQSIITLVEEDKTNRGDWERLIVEGIKLLGLEFEEVSEPFIGACAATHPLLIENVVKYQAKARSQLLPPGGPVKAEVLGKSTPEKIAKAQRVRRFMNYQITEQMPEYEPEHDRMLFYQGFLGSAFTKLWPDTFEGRPRSKFIRPQDFIVPYAATSLEGAERYTEVLTLSANDLKREQLAGIYRNVDASPQSSPNVDDITSEMDRIEGRSVSVSADPDTLTLYEVHINWDLPGFEHTDEAGEPTGLRLPYIITIDVESETVLAIYRNWEEEDAKQRKQVWYVHWPLIPGFGFYAYGYLHLIGGLSRTATSSLRRLIDAATFATLPAGFKVRGVRVVGDQGPLRPGEWRDINAPGIQNVQQAFWPLPYKGADPTLMALLEFVVASGQKFADTTEQIVSESTNYGPVGTTMALLEAGGRLFNAIHERIFYAQKQELRLLAEINQQLLQGQGQLTYPGKALGQEEVFVLPTDFDETIVDIIPVTNPRIPTEAHRIAATQAHLEVARNFPQFHNMPILLTEMHAALGEEDPTRYIIAGPPPVQPTDPVSENARIMMGLPVKAFSQQNHMAHIQVHATQLNDPAFQGNPATSKAVQAHIQEHFAMDFVNRMSARMGMQLPDPSAPQQQPTDPQQDHAIAAAAKTITEAVVKERTEMVGGMGVDLNFAADMAKIAIDKAKLQQDDKHFMVDKAFDKEELKLKKLDSDRKFTLERKKINVQEEQAEADRAQAAAQGFADRENDNTNANKDRGFKATQADQDRKSKEKQAKAKPKPKAKGGK